ncbi:uncharacterized protein LOC134272468 [Saccostrea cucullata]|uniref:uncharacterized protein LOC134272468 n=1 Tax=Saccostrea cuccullata TaxID=36930 RepID=UPI002ED6077C
MPPIRTRRRGERRKKQVVGEGQPREPEESDPAAESVATQRAPTCDGLGSAISNQSESTGLPKPDRISVWIVGSSIIKRAFIQSRLRPGGWSLGLSERGVDIWWQGYGGLKFIDLVHKVRHLATLEDPPRYLIIHCGANDLGQIKLSRLLYRIKWDIQLLSRIFTNTTLVWSFLLPRISWRHSSNVRATHTDISFLK